MRYADLSQHEKLSRIYSWDFEQWITLLKLLTPENEPGFKTKFLALGTGIPRTTIKNIYIFNTAFGYLELEHCNEEELLFYS